MELTGLKRRDFLKATALTGAAAALGGSSACLRSGDDVLNWTCFYRAAHDFSDSAARKKSQSHSGRFHWFALHSYRRDRISYIDVLTGKRHPPFLLTSSLRVFESLS